jgi:hypothetical protein
LLDRIRVGERAKVISLDDEGCIGDSRFEAPGLIDRVDDRQAKPAARRIADTQEIEAPLNRFRSAF